MNADGTSSHGSAKACVGCPLTRGTALVNGNFCWNMHMHVKDCSMDGECMCVARFLLLFFVFNLSEIMFGDAR
jgi:hypothetical protein